MNAHQRRKQQRVELEPATASQLCQETGPTEQEVRELLESIVMNANTPFRSGTDMNWQRVPVEDFR